MVPPLKKGEYKGDFEAVVHNFHKNQTGP